MAVQTLSARHFGDGPVSLLALHCTIAHGGTWRGVAAALGAGVTITAPDMLSHGKSPDWDRQGDFQDAFVAGLAPFLSQPTHLVGHSFGAVTALRLAVENPDKVLSLTLIEPVAFAIVQQDAPEMLRVETEDSKSFEAALRSGDDETAARLFNRMWGGGGPRWPDLPEPTRAAMVRGIHVVPASHGAVQEDRPGVLMPEALARLSMPVLLVRGSDTQPLIEVVNDGLARRIPHAQNEVIPGAGHMAPITHPVETAAIMRSVLDTA